MALTLDYSNFSMSSPSPREFGMLIFVTCSNDGRIHEERGLGGEEILLFQLNDCERFKFSQL